MVDPGLHIPSDCFDAHIRLLAAEERPLRQSLRTDEDAVRQLMRRLSRMGMRVEIAHHHLYDRAVAAELARIAHRLAADSLDGKITAAAFRVHIGSGRKLAIQILEFFGRRG